MATVALGATTENAASDVTYVSSAQTYPTRVFLADDFPANSVVRVEATSTGTIRILDANGRLIGQVGAERAMLAVSDDTGAWAVFPIVRDPAAHVANVAVSTDTVTERGNRINTCLAALRAAGLLKAE
jgi:hypothetical protein